MKAVKAVFVLGLLLFVSACARPTFVVARDEAIDPSGEFKYNRKQAEIAAERAVLTLAATYKDGKWELKRDIVKVEEMKKLLTDRAKSLDLLLRYDDKWSARFIDWLKGMRPAIEREERATLWALQQIQLVHTYNEFVDLVGHLPKELIGSDTEYFFEHSPKNYSIRMLYPAKDIAQIPFTASYLEEAKKQNKLKLVDSFTVLDSQNYSEKIPDFEDANKFSWDKRERGWTILSYKITATSDRPNDNVVQYIEVFRVDANTLKIEELPALRGFLAAGASNTTVFILDYDKAGENGFGSPDAVKKILQNIITGRDLYDNESLRKDLLVELYERPRNNKDRPERRRPPDPPVYVEIVPMGKKLKVDIWEMKKEGWNVPISFKDLFKNLEVVYGKPDKDDLEKIKSGQITGDLKKISLLIREFKMSGETVVVEYWKPKAEYLKMNVRSITGGIGASATYTLQRKGFPKEEAEIEYFGDKITQVDYFYGGLWFRIVDEDGDGTFEKRRQIADPTKSYKNTQAVHSNYGDFN